MKIKTKLKKLRKEIKALKKQLAKKEALYAQIMNLPATTETEGPDGQIIEGGPATFPAN